MSAIRAFAAHRDRAFLWLDGSRREVFDALYESIADGAPLAVLTGDVGVGKTMLTEAVAARLADEGAHVGRLLTPTRDAAEVWVAIVAAFGLGRDAPGREAALERFTHVVRQAATSSTRVLLVVDEAQSLPGDALRELLAVCEAVADAGAAGTLSVLLVGQDPLDGALARPELASLAARIAVRQRLPVLRASEVEAYVEHHLACADLPRDVVAADARRALARLSGGVPRLVDLLAARAAARGGLVDASMVERAARELTWLAAPDEGARPPRRHRMAGATLAAGVVMAALVAALVALRVPDAGHATHDAHESAAEDVVMPAADAASPEPTSTAPPAADGAREPDPGAIIDWLLRRPQPVAAGR